MGVWGNMFFGGGNVWKQYFSFQGRLSRAVFWFRFFILNIFVNIASSVMDSMLEDRPNVDPMPFMYILYGAYWVSLSSLWIRRMQDRNVSGWWYAVVAVLAPVALLFRVHIVKLMNAGDPAGLSMNVPSIVFGGIVFLIACAVFVVFGFFKGTEGENRFGEDPIKPDTTESGKKKGKKK